MSLEVNDTQLNVEANPVNGAEKPQIEGNQAQPQELNNDEGKIYSQKDLDNIAAKTRGATERETRKKLFAQLGLKDGDDSMLDKIKTAYENSLTNEERKAKELEELTKEVDSLRASISDKDYIIQALSAMSGKKESDVEKVVKMAKGLKTDDNTIEDCISDVLGMINKTNESKVPVGQPLNQPSSIININTATNPFKVGSINLTEQGRLWKENPELARKLAAEAGINLNL